MSLVYLRADPIVIGYLATRSNKVTLEYLLRRYDVYNVLYLARL
ncbi:hypothetical protein Slin14017_G041830 [Septoria linicola]|nr:hypothetical protein Slin14017_G041830 [Septoria linicola]